MGFEQHLERLPGMSGRPSLLEPLFGPLLLVRLLDHFHPALVENDDLNRVQSGEQRVVLEGRLGVQGGQELRVASLGREADRIEDGG